MYGLRELLVEEVTRLQAIKSIIDVRLQGAPEGHLRITSTRNNCTQYMLRMDRKPNKEGQPKSQETYIRKENLPLVNKLAQKAYDQKMQRLINRRLKQLTKLSEEYRDDEVEDIYNKLHPIRKELVNPVETPWEQRLQEWKSIHYVGKGFDPGTPEIYTKKGERVRSKSEKILADTFYELGIEYKYECPIKLKGYGVVYPDFTILRKKDGKEVYWEHDGRMDDPSYAEKAIRKINSYIANCIFPGERLIITYESSGVVISDKVIHQLISKYLIDLK